MDTSPNTARLTQRTGVVWVQLTLTTERVVFWFRGSEMRVYETGNKTELLKNKVNN